MIELYAPYPLESGYLALPSAEWGNAKRNASTVTLKRSMNGANAVTYVKSLPNSPTLECELNVSRLKAFEIEQFFQAYNGEKMRMVYHGTTYIGFLTLNPLSLNFSRRSVSSVNNTENVTFNLTFKSEP